MASNRPLFINTYYVFAFFSNLDFLETISKMDIYLAS